MNDKIDEVIEWLFNHDEEMQAKKLRGAVRELERDRDFYKWETERLMSLLTIQQVKDELKSRGVDMQEVLTRTNLMSQNYGINVKC